ncbi:unnamed protein product [Blepharisma stoltei]|uniref:Uncharacterized protein n=1 Tax=Blepharisma stoltei TaxID=1481888 RepID=A0AAU9J913_9CILI|nr:unnamed protein product [Blepharisma stoltei]
MYRFTDSQYTGSIRPSQYLSQDPIPVADTYHPSKLAQEYNYHDSIGSSNQFSLSLSQRDDPRQVEMLREEVNGLRKQLENLSIQNSRELLALNEKEDERLNQIYQEKDSQIQAEYRTISNIQRTLGEEADECSKIKQEILKVKLDHGETVAQLNAEIRNLIGEMEYLQKECIEPARGQIDMIRNEIENRKDEQNRESRNIQHNKGAELHELQYRIEKDNGVLNSLRIEVEEIQKQLSLKSIQSEENLGKLNDRLKREQNITTDQEGELKLLRGKKEKLRKEARDKAKEVGLIKYRVQNIEVENKELKEQLARLERLIYGRTKENLH